MSDNQKKFVMTPAFLPWKIRKELKIWEAGFLLTGRLPNWGSDYIDVGGWNDLLVDAIKNGELNYSGDEIEHREIDTKIAVSDLREWLESKEVFPPFFFPDHPDHPDNNIVKDCDSSIPLKRENTYLKMIGALLAMRYTKEMYFKSDGQVNASAIADKFDSDLGNSGFNDDGLKKDTIRKTIITQAFEAIKGNREKKKK